MGFETGRPVWLLGGAQPIPRLGGCQRSGGLQNLALADSAAILRNSSQSDAKLTCSGRSAPPSAQRPGV